MGVDFSSAAAVAAAAAVAIAPVAVAFSDDATMIWQHEVQSCAQRI